MSQTGFPNGGILPDDDADFTYSNIITTEADIRAAAQEIVNEAYISGTIDSKVADTVATSIEGLATAGLTLAQYYIQQVTYQGADGYGTENNPVEINYGSSVNELFAKSLGSDANPDSLYQSYQANSTNIDGIQNTFFNLGAGSKSFKWDANGNLTISDTYLFTGLDDLGAAPTVDQATSPGGLLAQFAKFFIGLAAGSFLVPLAQLKGDVNDIVKMLFGASAANFVDEGVPFNLVRWAQVNGQNATNIGLIEKMFFRKTFSPQELYENNPTLFFDAVAKGLIPFSVLVTLDNFICNSIEVGSGPDAFGFLPNYAPVNTVMSTDPSNWTFGGGGNYPRPFTSFAQRIVEATFSLGPFAMIDFKNTTTNVSARFSGRICNLAVVCNGAPGVTGFIRQNWYGADLSGTGYGSNLLKWQWWEQAIKTKYTFPYGHLPGYPEVTIEVATGSYAVGDANNFAPDIPTPEDYTLLLGTVLAAAALGAIL
jgi:hypothetical protein